MLDVAVVVVAADVFSACHVVCVDLALPGVRRELDRHAAGGVTAQSLALRQAAVAMFRKLLRVLLINSIHSGRKCCLAVILGLLPAMAGITTTTTSLLAVSDVEQTAMADLLGGAQASRFFYSTLSFFS